MKSKFIDKIVLINDDYYSNYNHSPYVFITSIDKNSGSLDMSYLDIQGIDRRGNKFKTSQHRSWLYKKLEIIDVGSDKHLLYDFIKGIFNVRNI